MLEPLQKMKNTDYDMIAFMPSEKDENQIVIERTLYADPGEDLERVGMGDYYHILIFKENENGEVLHRDLFEAILTEPLEYISYLIPNHWFGMVARKTTKSPKLIQTLFDELQKI
jgi:hypothetical protein